MTKNIRGLISIFSLFFAFFLSQDIAYSDVTLKKFTEPVSVKILTTLDTQATPAQTPYQIQFEENIYYQDKVLLKGTKLLGTITTIKPSRRLGRNAKYIVQFQELVVPSGENEQVSTISNCQARKPSKDDCLVTFRKFRRLSTRALVTRQILINLAGTAVALPIVLLTNADGWTYFAIDNAVEGLVGAIVEGTSKDIDDTRSASKKAAVGFLKGISAVPTIVGLVKRAPNIHYQAGQVTLTRLPKAFWLVLFDNKTPSQP